MLYTLAVDLGASSGRVMRAGFTGDQLTVEQIHRFPNQPAYVNDGMFWDIHTLFDNIKVGLTKGSDTAFDIRSIGIDSWAVDFALVDQKGQLLDLPRHYRDQRNVSAMQAVLQRIDQAELFHKTGIQLQPFNTLFQLYALQQDQPEMLARADRLLLIPDLLNYFLTGHQKAEFTNATTTQFLNPHTMNWDEDLLSSLQLPTHLLPEIAQPGTLLGPLAIAQLQNHAALSSAQVVHTASHDTAAAVLSVPQSSQTYAYISSGTWSLMGTVVERPMMDEKIRAWNFTNEGGLNNFRLLKNVMGLWLIQETQHSLRLHGHPADIELLVHRARLAPRFTYLFDPDDPRLLSPDDMPAMIRQICKEHDQTAPDDIGSLVRGIFESLALKYRFVLGQLEQVTQIHYDVIHIVGGGSQNDLLNQFTANATGRMVIAGPVEASAMGNALVQLLALGQLHSTTEMTELLRCSVSLKEYIPTDQCIWDATYEMFYEKFKGA